MEVGEWNAEEGGAEGEEGEEGEMADERRNNPLRPFVS